MPKNLDLYHPSFPVPAVGSLGAYIQWTYQVPVLSESEERALARRFFHEGDLEAARLLVLAHLRFVVQIARHFSGYGLMEADLIQEGNIGLLKAVKRFNPDMEVRLVTFAVHWIKSEIHEYIIRNWRIVKIASTKAQRKLFFNLRKMGKRLGWQTEEEINEVAKTLNVPREEVIQMEMRMKGYDESLTPLPNAEDESARPSESYHLEDKSANPASILETYDWEFTQTQRLQKALTTLDPRSRAILEKRWLGEEKITLESLAEQFGISLERVRQLEKAALLKLKQLLVPHLT